MLPLVLWGLTGLIGFLREMPREKVVVGETCEGCGYSLRGLPPAGVCPECGGSYAGNGTARVVNRGWRLGVVRPGLLVFTLVFVLAVGVWPELARGSIVRWIEAEALIQRGYRPDVAWRAVTMAPSYGCGCGRHGGVLAPEAFGAALLPLVGRLPGRWAWRVAITMSVVTVGGALAMWLRAWLWT